ncbi:hypothetical protein AB3G45_03430 [Shinella sp. S4-D37]|uniref:hypothetical protein n=1 Tax=Shinella sp. S4-D37 TaxID=3161999 RepID=UPI00346794AA
MIRNAIDMLYSRSRKTLPAFFQGRRSSQASPRDVQPDICWDDASVGMFICGIGRGVYAHPLKDSIPLTFFQGQSYKLDSDRDR